MTVNFFENGGGANCQVQWKGPGIHLTPSKVVETKEINYWDKEFAQLGFHDRFVVRWTGKINVKGAGKYTFKTCSDDGSNVFIGDTKVVDNDGLHGRRCREAPINLKAGEHTVTVNFFENGGGANCQVQWKGPDIILTPTKVVEASEINYNDHSFAKLGFNDRFVVYWTGKTEVSRAGTYTFQTCSDDGSNLYIGDTKVVDNDGLHGRTCRQGSIRLAAGLHDVTVKFFENGGGANCDVKYRGPDVGDTWVWLRPIGQKKIIEVEEEVKNKDGKKEKKKVKKEVPWKVELVLQDDGNLVLYREDDKVLWSSGTAGRKDIGGAENAVLGVSRGKVALLKKEPHESSTDLNLSDMNEAELIKADEKQMKDEKAADEKEEEEMKKRGVDWQPGADEQDAEEQTENADSQKGAALGMDDEITYGKDPLSSTPDVGEASDSKLSESGNWMKRAWQTLNRHFKGEGTGKNEGSPLHSVEQVARIKGKRGRQINRQSNENPLVASAAHGDPIQDLIDSVTGLVN